MKTEPANRVDVMFRALSDRTRLRIMHMLGGGELCVCHIVDVLGVPQPKTSRHLAYLRKAGLVMCRKQGLWCYYRLAEPTSDFHAKLIDCLSSCCKEVPQLPNDSKRLPTCPPSCCA
jgi:ArsR family transcriptional regulator